MCSVNNLCHRASYFGIFRLVKIKTFMVVPSCSAEARCFSSASWKCIARVCRSSFPIGSKLLLVKFYDQISYIVHGRSTALDSMGVKWEE